MSTKRVLYWFRTDLRLADSPALKAALDLKPTAFYPIWCWDPHYVFSQSVGPNRWQFLLDSMKDVSSQITGINSKSKLFVIRGSPQTILPALFKEWGITDIVWEKDDDVYTQARDRSVSELALAAGVKVHVVLGYTLYDSAIILAKNKGSRPGSYGGFLKTIASLPPPPQPIDAPKAIPDPGTLDLKGWTRDEHSVERWRRVDNNKIDRTGGEEDKTYESFSGPNGDFDVPTMEELNMVAEGKIRGGETNGRLVFEAFMKDTKRVAEFEKPKTSPAAFEPASTTVLSPHLKFGTLSVRTFYHRVMAINAKAKSHSTPPESLVGQLLWREFFHANQFATPNYTQIKGNSLSRYINWNLQTRYDAEGNRLEKEAMVEIWKKEEPVAFENYLAWQEGRTGFPWIDALMRQVVKNGWMHHLGRHSVACFLTRGQLWISWERGADVFDRHLVDQDPAVNAGNWMWLSASAFFHQYYRVYSPATFGQKSDPTGALIREFCPELAKFPDKFIYEPWKAPLATQKAAGCVLGVDYPNRIVDDKEAKEENLSLIKMCYAAHIQGNDPRVLNGTADAYIKTFASSAASKAKKEDGEDGEEDEKPDTKGKRKAPPAKKESGAKQTKLSFAKKE